MTLHEPFIIGPRLMPALQVGGATVSLEIAGCRGGRNSYRGYVDLPDGSEHEINDLSGRGDLQDGFSALLSFLGAAAESYSYRTRTGRTGENEDLFVPAVVQWAYQNEDEIGMLALETEERPGLIED